MRPPNSERGAQECLTKLGLVCWRGMATPLASNALWTFVEPLISPEPPPRLDNHAELTGILCVLRTGIPRELLPVEMGCGSGMTCWRRLHEWHKAGI